MADSSGIVPLEVGRSGPPPTRDFVGVFIAIAFLALAGGSRSPGWCVLG
jgi:hypothetical protein